MDIAVATQSTLDPLYTASRLQQEMTVVPTVANVDIDAFYDDDYDAWAGKSFSLCTRQRYRQMTMTMTMTVTVTVTVINDSDK